jgi:hypothetical protein
MFDFAEEALDELRSRWSAGCFPDGFRRNDRGDGPLLEDVDQQIGIVGLSPIKAPGSAFSSNGLSCSS